VLGERLRGLVQRCGDVLGLPVGMLIDDLVDAHPSGDHPQHGHDREAKAPDAGLAIHFVTLDRDAVVDLCAHRRSSQIPVVRVPTVAVSTLVDLCPSESHRICQPPPAVRLAAAGSSPLARRVVCDWCSPGTPLARSAMVHYGMGGHEIGHKVGTKASATATPSQRGSCVMVDLFSLT
jgi:hypothetical protein